MLTIPTGEWTGLLSDVIPFALDNKDFPQVNVVQLSWDGEQLHAAATDMYNAARSTWDPEAETQDDGTTYGGNDRPWSLCITLADAKSVNRDFKLTTKKQYVPLTLNLGINGLTVARSREYGETAKTVILENQPVPFPNVDKELTADPDQAASPGEVFYSPTILAKIGHVRPRDLVRMAFSDKRTHLTIGTSFAATLAQETPGSTHRTGFIE